MSKSGFDGLQREMEKLSKAANKLDGNHQLSAEELLHPLFMLENTGFGSIDEFFAASPFPVKTQEEFDAIEPDSLDSYVREKTRFQSWQELVETAAQEWMTKRFHEELG